MQHFVKVKFFALFYEKLIHQKVYAALKLCFLSHGFPFIKERYTHFALIWRRTRLRLENCIPKATQLFLVLHLRVLCYVSLPLNLKVTDRLRDALVKSAIIQLFPHSRANISTI